MKSCSSCGETKPKTEFYKSGLYYTSACKICRIRLAKEWKLKNPERTKVLKEKSRLKMNFGLTHKTWETLFNSQDGCCAICKRHQIELKRKLVVDHNHTTGQVRGLLCVICNVRVGVYETYKNKIKEYLS